MAKKVVFTVKENGILRRILDMKLPGGFALSQAQKGIRMVHESFQKNFKGNKPLEVSTKSEEELGKALSAFNLKDKDGHTVEQRFQSAKVFEKGGPYLDLLDMPSRAAKKDERLKTSGRLTAFQLNGTDYPLVPRTAFYNWLYISTLLENKELVDQLLASGYEDFTDYAFNPEKSLNCQAEAIALFVFLNKTSKSQNFLEEGISFDEIVKIQNEINL